MKSWQGRHHFFLVTGFVAATAVAAAAQDVPGAGDPASGNYPWQDAPAADATEPPRTILPEPGASRPIRPDLGTGTSPADGMTTSPPDLWRELGSAGIEVETLRPAGPGSIGLIDQASGGFAPDLWTGSRSGTILNLLSIMPDLENRPALHGLLRRLLLTAAPPPGQEPLAGAPRTGAGIDDGQDLDFFVAKLDRLAAMGDLESIQGLLARLGRGNDDPRVTRHRVTAYLLGGNYNAACDAASGGVPAEAAVDWLRVAAFCRHLNDDAAGASLALEMLREQDQQDPVFMSLMAAAMRGETPEIAGPVAPSPVVLALADLMRVPLPEIDLDDTDPLVLARIATLPHLAIDQRAAAARKALSHGALAPARLAQIYGALRFTPEQFENMELLIDDMPEAAAEALVFQAALSAQDLSRRAEIVSYGLRRARAADAEGFYAGFMAPALAILSPAAEIQGFALDAVRLALLAGDTERAQEWYRFVRDAAQMGDGQAAAALTELWPLIMVGAPMEDVAYSPENLDAWWDRRQQLDDPERDVLALTLFTLLEADGHFVPEHLWSNLMNSPAASEGGAPNLSLWRGFSQAADAGRVGETALMAVVAAGGSAATPVVVSGVARALTTVGLEREARALAITALIGRGL